MRQFLMIQNCKRVWNDEHLEYKNTWQVVWWWKCWCPFLPLAYSIHLECYEWEMEDKQCLLAVLASILLSEDVWSSSQLLPPPSVAGVKRSFYLAVSPWRLLYKAGCPTGCVGGISQCLVECLGLEGIPKPNQFQPPAVGSATQQHRLFRAPSSLALSASRVGAPTVSMGSCARVSLPSQGRTSPWHLT